MKVYIVVAGLLISLLVLGIYTLHAFDDTAMRMANTIDRLETDIFNSDWTEAENKVGDIKREWDGHKQWWTIFIDHREIDNIDTALARTLKFIETRERASAVAELAALRLMIKNIPEKERINIKNVL